MHPAPIFNRKPRQGLLAHPNNTVSSNDKAGFYTVGPKKQSGYNSNNNNSSGPSAQPWSNRQPQPETVTGTYQVTSQAQAQLPNRKRAYSASSSTTTSTRKPFGAISQSAQNLQQSGLQPTPRPSSRPTPGPNKYHGGQPAPQDSWPAEQPWGSPCKPQTLQQGPAVTQTLPQRQGNSARPGPSGVARGGSRPNRNVGMGAGRSTMVQDTTGPPPPLPKPAAPESEPPQVAPPGGNTGFKMAVKDTVAEPTLHFLAATIEGMRHWSRTKLPLIFELIGSLGSAVTNTDSGIARQFVLKDSKQSVQCTFYSIDRELPRMIRGHLYRCVGQLAPDGKRFRSVTIREATEEERELHRAKVAASDKVMRTCSSSAKEF